MNKKIDSFELFQITKGTSIVFLGILIWGVVNYLFNMYLAQKLNPAVYGVYSVGLAIFNILGIICLLGLDQGLVRYIALYKGEENFQRIKGIIVSSLILVSVFTILISILLFIFSGYISENLFHKKELKEILRFFSAILPLFGVFSVFVFSFQGFRAVKYIVYTKNLFEPLTRFFFVAIFFLFGLKIIGVMLSHLLALILSVFLSYFFIKKIFPSFEKVSLHFEMKSILLFSFPLFLSKIFQIGIEKIDTLMLSYFKQIYKVGIYNASLQTAFIGSIILSSFNIMFAPIISDYYNRRKVKNLEKLFKGVTKQVFTFSLPVFLIIFLFSKEILSIWGKSFIEGTNCLKILTIGQLVNSFTGSVGFMLIMTGRVFLTLLNNLITFFLQIILCLILIPKYGILGAGISTAFSLIFVNLLRLFQVYFILKIHPYKLSFLKPFLAAIVTFFVLNFLRGYLLKNFSVMFTLIFSLFICVILYGTILFKLGIDEEEKEIILKIKSSLKSSHEKKV